MDWSALPGAENLRVNGAFNMFAGYLTIDEEHGRKVFYWFMEAQDNPEDAPVVRTRALPASETSWSSHVSTQ